MGTYTTVENGTINFNTINQKITDDHIQQINNLTSQFPHYTINTTSEKISITFYDKKTYYFTEELQSIINLIHQLGITISYLDITTYDDEDNETEYNLHNNKIISTPQNDE